MADDEVASVSIAETLIDDEEEVIIEAEVLFYMQMENDYKRVLDLIEKNDDLRPIADDYIKLFDAYQESFNSGRTMAQRIQDLEKEISDNSSTVTAALQKTILDKQTIDKLEADLDHTFRVADAAHQREQNAKETIENLRKQINKLSAELETKEKLEAEPDEESAAANKQKDNLQREKDRLEGEVEQLKARIVNAMSYQEDLERKNSAADARINALSLRMEEENNEKKLIMKDKLKLEEEIKSLASDLEKTTAEVDVITEKLDAANLQNEKHELTIETLKMKIEALNIDVETLNARINASLETNNQLKAEKNKLNDEIIKKGRKLNARTHELKACKRENLNLTKDNTALDKRVKLLETGKTSMEAERNKLREVMGNMDREIELSKKQADQDRRLIDNLNREKDVLQKNIKRAEALSMDHIKIIKYQEQAKRKLEQEISTGMREMNRQRKIIAAQEKEKERVAAEIIELTKNIKNLADEIGLKQNEIVDYKKQLVELEGKLRTTQNMFEAIRAERNSFQKCLQEATTEIADLKNKLKICSHQTEQLKEDISSKETQVIRLDNTVRKSHQLIEQLKVEIQTGVDNLHSAKREIVELKEEIKSLNKNNWELDAKIKKAAKELEQIMNERDILGSQLVRRNDELSLLYEKIEILQQTLHQGEAQYDQRLDDIQLLKTEIKRLRQEKNLLTRTITNMTDLRQEVFNIERDLTRERLKCRALEEELQNPLNIHRWRKLEGSDPETLELLQKIQLLQKRTLALGSELIEKERQLKELETLYTNLQNVLTRQPPNEDLARELIKTQRALQLKSDKLKSLVSELNMSEKLVEEYKLDINRLQTELNEFKKKYYELKKKEGLARIGDKEKGDHANEKERFNLDDMSNIKFAGGGFKFA